MRSYVSNWMSLRKKITGLAFIPALITSIVTYGYVMQALDANMQTAQMLLEKEGGVHQAGTDRWDAVNEETHQAAMVSAPTLSIGGWKAVAGAGAGPLGSIAGATGKAVVLYARIDSAGDMMRVAGTSPDGALRA